MSVVTIQFIQVQKSSCTIMESGSNATTPLFMQQDINFISPTRPLEISDSRKSTQYIDSKVDNSGIFGNQKERNKVPSSKSLQSVSNSSYITAQSVDLDQLSVDEDLVNAKPLTAWTHEDLSCDLTPIIRSSEVLAEDMVTPKVEEHNTTFESIRTDDLGFDFTTNRIQREAGLGISKRSSLISGYSPTETNTETQVKTDRSSPVKAIRTSMIINGQIEYEDRSGTELNTLNNRDLYNISYNDKSFIKEVNNTKGLERKVTMKKSSEMNLDDENFAYLFIIAIHSFDATSLQNQDDVSICLSFKKHDVAFVHTVDESGWGEVTLLRNAERGWVPFNYFSDTVKSAQIPLKDNDFARMIDTRIPLQKLLSAGAKFLLHPRDSLLPDGVGLTFNVEYINGVRDGVKTVLEMTDCVSRSNELVHNKPDIRKARKVLLANWYNLMIKADYYKHTTSQKHIDTLIKLLFEVLNQAFVFFSIWSVEKKAFDDEKNTEPKTSSTVDGRHAILSQELTATEESLYLSEPPSAMNRLHEVYDLLFSYVGLILGRLDMIEHNPSGCEALETIVHQMIILLRDLLYISKSCSAIIQEKFQYAYENTLHKNLDPLLSLVSELVSCVKVLVTQTLQEDLQIETSRHLIKDEGYHYTDQGQRLTEIVSNMATLISNSITGCSSYLRLIGDIPLGSDRKYLDLRRIKMSPENFIKQCSQGLAKHLDKKILNETLNSTKKEVSHSTLARFSTIRAGTDDQLGFTFEGTQFLRGIMLDQRPFGRESTFEPFKVEEIENDLVEQKYNNINCKEVMESEMTYAKDGGLLGASFRALVFKLTDEIDKPDDFLTAATLLNFPSFGTAADLIDGLIARFDLTEKSLAYDYGEKNTRYSSRSSRLKNRRRLVCKVFHTWMESYWDYRSGYKFLPTMINFFNEVVSMYLPIESKSLLEIAARLSALTPSSKKYKLGPKIRDQLSPMTISKPKTSSIYSDLSSVGSRLSVFSLDEKIIEEYELTKLPSYNTNSVSLPIPILNLGTSSLISKRNLQDMERLVSSYRSAVAEYIPSSQEKTLLPKEDTTVLLFEWNELLSSGIRNPRNIVNNDLNLTDLNPLEVAKQLTLIESQLFLAIKPSELLNENFLEKKQSLDLAPNVGLIVNFTNELSNYVLESLLYPRMTLKCRSTRLKTWLKIALSTTYFRNYNSLTSIMTSLQNHAVTRLAEIWDALNPKEYELYEYLSKIVHPNNNFKVYRKKIRRYIEETPSGELQTEKSAVPVVPFFNLFLQDLTFIYEGNNSYRNPESFRPNKIINIDKFLKVTKTINMVRYFQVNYETNEEHSENVNSFFNISAQIDVDTQHIRPIFLLQEFILFEFWRVNNLYTSCKDRGYQLSIQLLPRK